MAELNGAPVAVDDLKALALYNYGHFTSMRVENRSVRRLSRHLGRLAHDCRVMFGHDLDVQKVHELIRRSVGQSTGSFIVRVTIYDPGFDMGHPAADAAPQVLVTKRSALDWPPPPIRVMSTRYRRELPLVKHVGILGLLWHRRQAQIQGFDDALFFDDADLITEGGTWNVGFFDGSRVVWPDADILPGITMNLLKDEHADSETRPISVHDLKDMEAAFATNVTVGVRAIAAIDDRQFPADHPIIQTLRAKYIDIPAEPL